MPKLDAKIIQRELESKKIRRLYWLHGVERMMIRGLLKKIEKAVLSGRSRNDFNYEKLEAGNGVSLDSVLDSFQGFSFGGGVKLVVVTSADDLAGLDCIVDWLKQNPFQGFITEDNSNVLVLIGKGFDSRRKWAKALLEEAAVLDFPEVLDAERAPWIEKLAKGRGLELNDSELDFLCVLDPWSLDIADQELSKLDLLKDDLRLRGEVLLSGLSAEARDSFMNAIFCRDKKTALKWSSHFVDSQDTMLPLLGLVAWNIRQLKSVLLEQVTGMRSGARMYPTLVRNLNVWKNHWTLTDLAAFEEELFQIDFASKNRRTTGLGLWGSAIQRLRST